MHCSNALDVKTGICELFYTSSLMFNKVQDDMKMLHLLLTIHLPTDMYIFKYLLSETQHGIGLIKK